MINDNNPNGPRRAVIAVEALSLDEVRNLPDDGEPYVQKITLSCMHWCFNTYGNRHPKYKIGDIIKCLTCGQKGKT